MNEDLERGIRLNTALKLLAEIVAWDGEEDRESACNRLKKAERFVKKHAPELLKAEREKVKELYD